MFAAFTRSLAAKRARLEKDEKGFTLIELLVVVIIIGILAAIAIPIFLGQQESARESAVKTDLGNAKLAVVAFQVDNPTATTVALTEDVLGDYGFTDSPETVFVTTDVDPRADFSIVATSVKGKSFTITASGGLTETPGAD